MKLTAKMFVPAASLLLAAAIGLGQTAAPKTATKTAPKTASKTTTSTAAKTHPASSTALPKNIPPVRGVPRTLYTLPLRYVDVAVGKGELAVPGKMFTVNYTGWLRATGVEFDSSIPDKNHPQRKPITFPAFVGAVIPVFDTAFQGMRVGGKRRVFIPALLAYANHGSPTRPGTPQVVPPKADLVFDIELVSMSDPPKPAMRPMMPPLQPRPVQPGTTTLPTTPRAPGSPNAAPVPNPVPNTPAAAPSTPAATPSPATPATTPPHPE